ncbi:hypothetical protein LWI28_001103 [Acer negundo]|uniref:Uncharacterized protein n=1 Tax=Acer negundo TaxID=4023 RepID=A0AAD5NMQ7_ACENE|nr:hypothetical protein LWI28_001103 [Acer negundo]
MVMSSIGQVWYLILKSLRFKGVARFISGLREDIRDEICLLSLRNLLEAIDLATRIENDLVKEKEATQEEDDKIVLLILENFTQQMVEEIDLEVVNDVHIDPTKQVIEEIDKRIGSNIFEGFVVMSRVLNGQIVSTLGFGFENVKTKGLPCCVKWYQSHGCVPMAVTGDRRKRTLFDEDQECYRTSSGNRESHFGRVLSRPQRQLMVVGILVQHRCLKAQAIGEANIEGGVPTDESVLHHHLTANLEEFFKICKPNVQGSKESQLGLELVGKMDGSSAMGESWSDRERTQRLPVICKEQEC